jgi:hypothetical protein
MNPPKNARLLVALVAVAAALGAAAVWSLGDWSRDLAAEQGAAP